MVWPLRQRATLTWHRRDRTRSCCPDSSTASSARSPSSKHGWRVSQHGCRGEHGMRTRHIELARAKLRAWLRTPDAVRAVTAFTTIGAHPEHMVSSLDTVTEEPSSAAAVADVVERAKHE